MLQVNWTELKTNEIGESREILRTIKERRLIDHTIRHDKLMQHKFEDKRSRSPSKNIHNN